MAAAYYPPLDLVKIDADGVRIPLPSETVDVYNVTTSTSLGTIASDADGIIQPGSFGAAAGDIVELSHASYPLVQQLTLAATQEEAYFGNPLAYLVENLVAAESLATRVDIYAWDRNSTNPPYFTGVSGPRNVSVEIPFKAGTVAQDIRLYSVPVTEKDSLSETDFSKLPYQDITIPVAGTGVYQPVDATLTALAGQNWAANAVPVGTGADTLTQLSITANTFPARSSAGNVAAKAITDFGLSLVDDANNTAARSTLGLVIGTNVQAWDTELDSLAAQGVVQGDLIHGSGANAYTKLAKDANATRYLSNQGTSNNPSWNQVNLANGVTGDLPFANLTQVTARSVLGVTGNSTADAASIQGTTDQVLRVDSAGTGLAFGTVATGGIANDAVTYAKIQNVSATNKLLGRSTAGSGDVEEIDIGAWSTWTPTITAFAGTITTSSAAGRYKVIGKIVIFSVKITITTNGTGATKVICTLPLTSVNSGANQSAFGMENGITGTSIAGAILNNSTTMYLTTYNNGYPGGNGYVLEISGVYEIA